MRIFIRLSNVQLLGTVLSECCTTFAAGFLSCWFRLFRLKDFWYEVMNPRSLSGHDRLTLNSDRFKFPGIYIYTYVMH